jgi:hypothetical protein
MYVNDVEQTEVHAPEPLVPQLKSFEVKIAVQKVERV